MTDIEIHGGEALPDGRLAATFIWPFAGSLQVPNKRYALIERASLSPEREAGGQVGWCAPHDPCPHPASCAITRSCERYKDRPASSSAPVEQAVGGDGPEGMPCRRPEGCNQAKDCFIEQRCLGEKPASPPLSPSGEGQPEWMRALFVEFDVAAYVDEYEFRGDSDHTPTEWEALLIVDALSGAIADLHEKAIAAWNRRPASPVTEAGPSVYQVGNIISRSIWFMGFDGNLPDDLRRKTESAAKEILKLFTNTQREASGTAREAPGTSRDDAAQAASVGVQPVPRSPVTEAGKGELLPIGGAANGVVFWVEPKDGGPEPEFKCLPVAEAIKAAKQSAAAHGHTYATDQQALDDFITVHWAEVLYRPSPPKSEKEDGNG
jgi:hypothetical protein